MDEATALMGEITMLLRKDHEQMQQFAKALMVCATGFDRIEQLIFESGESSDLVNEIYAVSRQTCEAVDKLVPETP